jgi:hypothetical protein
MSLLLGPRRALVFPIPRRKNRQLLAELPPRGQVTTNYSGERDSDEMKRSDLAPFSLFLHFSQFALNLCPPFTHLFSGAQMSRNARKELVCATLVLLLISGAEEPTIYLLRAFAPLTLFAMGLDR